MQKEEMTIKELAEKRLIVIDYSDEDIIIIDNVKQLAEPNPTRIRMNIVAVAKKGKSQLSVNGHTIVFAEGQLLLCPPGTTFDDFLLSPDFEFKAVFLTNRIIQSFLREKMSVWNETMYVYKMHVVDLEPRDIDFMSHFYDALRILIDAPADHYPYRSEVIQALLRSAFLGLCGALETRLPADAPVREPRSGQADTLFRRFLGLVSEGKTKGQTVEDYASELCVSPKHLSNVCKKNSGKTAGEWIREHILEEIRYYLKQTDLSMKEISDRLGFANPSFFGKYVKAHFGMTPMQFRRK